MGNMEYSPYVLFHGALHALLGNRQGVIRRREGCAAVAARLYKYYYIIIIYIYYYYNIIIYKHSGLLPSQTLSLHATLCSASSFEISALSFRVRYMPVVGRYTDWLVCSFPSCFSSSSTKWNKSRLVFFMSSLPPCCTLY